MFAEAKKAKWEMDFENYQVDFFLKKVENTALFRKDGTWLKTVAIIVSNDLPKSVKDALSKELGGLLANYTYEIIEKISVPIVGDSYKVTVKKNEELSVILITEKGEIIKAEGNEE